MCSLVGSREQKVYQFKQSGDIHCLLKGKLVENEIDFVLYKMKHELTSTDFTMWDICKQNKDVLDAQCKIKLDLFVY